MSKHQVWNVVRYALFVVFALAIMFSAAWIYNDYRAVESGDSLSASEKAYDIKGEYLYSKKVLVISSYNATYSIVPEEEDGIYYALKDAGIAYETEYMYSKELGSNPGHEENFLSSLKEHLAYHDSTGTKFSGIMAGDDDALRFCMKYKDELFAGLPIVFYAVNDIQYAQECASDPLVTGSIEKTYLPETIDLAKHLIPDASELIMIRDDSSTCQGDWAKLQSLASSYPGMKISDINTQSMTTEEFCDKIGKLSDKAIVISSIALKSGEGRSYSILQRSNMIGRYANVPVFSCYMHFIGTGCTAGDAMFMRDCGEVAGTQMAQILNDGVSPSQIPLQEQGFHRIAIDQAQMDKYQLKLEPVPDNALVLNKTLGFWDTYSAILIPLFIIIIFSLFGAVVLLIIDGVMLRRARQEMARSAEEARAANEAKTIFLSTMSHDIRTPMNAIVGMTAMARKELGDDSRVQGRLDQIDLSSRHLLMLVNDVLDISEIERGGVRINARPFSVSEVANDIEEIITRGASERRQQFDFVVKNECGSDELVGDPIRLTQVMVNILGNAVKFTPEGGHIGSVIHIGRKEGEPQVAQCRFEAIDDGPGMPAEFQKTMYDPFVRAEDGRLGANQGAGLGLSIVKAIVDQLGGTIVCESNVNEGTHFTLEFELPIAEAGASDAPRETLQGLRMLVTEDIQVNWMIAHELLASDGAETDWAHNGQECVGMLEAAPAGTYDIVLMDIQMPVMDGMEATARIRESELEYVRNIPIVAVTADAFAESVRRCREIGMNGHVAKPYDMDSIRSEILKVLG